MIDHPRTWDHDDRVLQSLYGLSLWDKNLEASQPRFGPGVTLPLRTRNIDSIRRLAGDPNGAITGEEEEEQIQDQPPTMPTLTWHFGHMDWAMENVKSLIRKSKGIIQATDFDERFFLAAQRCAVQEFVSRRVCPLSRAALALEYPLYVQGVPPRTLDLELTTSKYLSMSGEERVLAVLPKTVKAAQFFRMTDPEIQLCAPLIVWVINYRCAHNIIRTPEQLVQALDEWAPYLADPMLLFKMHERIEKRHPHLLTTESKRALLP
jgi:hypothetical protein